MAKSESQAGRSKFKTESETQAELDMQGQRTLNQKEQPKRTISRAIFMLLHSAVSLQRRQFCRPNSVLFMQKPSQKSARTQGCSGCCSIIHQAEKCILIEVPLNLGHHFSQLFFFFHFFFFSSAVCNAPPKRAASHNPPPHWDYDC